MSIKLSKSIKRQGDRKYTDFRQVKGDEPELVRHSIAAYFRAGGLDQPDGDKSSAEKFQGKYYTVLRNSDGVLAVYRIRAFDAVLKRLRRWPSEIEKAADPARELQEYERIVKECEQRIKALRAQLTR